MVAISIIILGLPHKLIYVNETIFGTTKKVLAHISSTTYLCNMIKRTPTKRKAKVILPKPVLPTEVTNQLKLVGERMRRYYRKRTDVNYQRYLKELDQLSQMIGMDIHQCIRFVNNHFRIKN